MATVVKTYKVASHSYRASISLSSIQLTPITMSKSNQTSSNLLDAYDELSETLKSLRRVLRLEPTLEADVSPLIESVISTRQNVSALQKKFQ